MIENPNRRKVIKTAVALAGTPIYGFGNEALATRSNKVVEPKEWLNIIPNEYHAKEGEWVDIDHLKQALPTPDPKDLLGRDTGLIISKRFHRFWLFKDGQLLKEGPVGTARVSAGMDTPEGLFPIIRKENESYSSREFPTRDPDEPNMPWAVFFHYRGIAFHGSHNLRTLKEPGTNKIKTYLRVDNSHGCANALKEDAELVNSILKNGDMVAVLK